MSSYKHFTSSLKSLILLLAFISTSQLINAQTKQDDKNKLAGKWVILSVNGTTANNEDEIYLTFDNKKKRFYGSTGCNTINGTFSSSSKALSFNNVATTQRHCKSELDVANALKGIKNYTISSDGSYYTLSLLNQKGKTALTLHRNCLKDLNGAWKINHITHRGRKIEMTSNVNNAVCIILDTDAETLRGNTGYNAIKGMISLSPENDIDIDFYDMETTTQLECTKPNQENLLKMAFESVTEVIDEEEDGYIELADSKKHIVINMSKIKERQTNN